MPVPTLEQVRKREASIKKKIAAGGAAAKPADRRALGKKLRRTQRKRRRMVAVAARPAPGPQAAGEGAAAGAGPEAQKSE
jgi:hypothetical protein